MNEAKPLSKSRITRFTAAGLLAISFWGIGYGYSWAQSLFSPIWKSLASSNGIGRYWIIYGCLIGFFMLASYPVSWGLNKLYSLILFLLFRVFIGGCAMNTIALVNNRYLQESKHMPDIFFKADDFFNRALLWYDKKIYHTRKIGDGSYINRINKLLKVLTLVVAVLSFVVLIFLSVAVSQELKSPTMKQYGDEVIGLCKEIDVKLSQKLNITEAIEYKAVSLVVPEEKITLSATTPYQFVVTAGNAAIYNAANDSQQPIGTIHADNILEYDSMSEDDSLRQWVSVKTPLGGIGWMPLQSLRLAESSSPTYSAELLPSAVEASSFLTDEMGEYFPENCLDHDASTTWAVGENESMWAVFKFKESINLKSMRFINGFSASQELYTWNGRPKLIKIEFSNGEFVDCTLLDIFTDNGRGHIIDLNRAVNTNTVKISVLDVYPGSHYPDIAISEISFFS